MIAPRTLDPVRRCEELLALISWMADGRIYAVRTSAGTYRVAERQPNGRPRMLRGEGESRLEALLCEFRARRVVEVRR
jgi:hypothetical protein